MLNRKKIFVVLYFLTDWFFFFGSLHQFNFFGLLWINYYIVTPESIACINWAGKFSDKHQHFLQHIAVFESWNTTKFPMTKTSWHWITETKQEDLKYYQNGRRLVVCLFVFFFPKSKGLLVNSPIPYNFLYYNLWEISLKIGSLALPLYIHTHAMYFLSTLIIFLWKFT